MFARSWRTALWPYTEHEIIIMHSQLPTVQHTRSVSVHTSNCLVRARLHSIQSVSANENVGFFSWAFSIYKRRNNINLSLWRFPIKIFRIEQMSFFMTNETLLYEFE